MILDEAIDKVSDDDIVTAMIGRELEALFPERPKPTDETVLEAKGLQVEGASEPVSFTVRAGEIFGLAGLVGAGRTELLEAVFGARHSTAGEILVRGKLVKRNAPAAAMAEGMAMAPEDRKLSGVSCRWACWTTVPCPDCRRSPPPAGCAPRRAPQRCRT